MLFYRSPASTSIHQSADQGVWEMFYRDIVEKQIIEGKKGYRMTALLTKLESLGDKYDDSSVQGHS